MENLQMFVVPFLLFGISKIEWTQDRIFFAQVAYVVAHVITFAVVLILRLKIKRTPNDKVIDAPVEPTGWPMQQNNATEKMTVQEYDLKQWSKMLSGYIMPFLMISFIAYKWNVVIPLVTQSILVPWRLFQENLVRIYIRGQNVERPFPPPSNPFASLMEAAQQQQQQQTQEKKKSKKKSE